MALDQTDSQQDLQIRGFIGKRKKSQQRTDWNVEVVRDQAAGK